MTQQQIADTLGVDQATVSRDVNMQMHIEDSPATITNSRGQQRPATYTPVHSAKSGHNTGHHRVPGSPATAASTAHPGGTSGAQHSATISASGNG
jgi:hypothetical protein